MVSDRGTPTPGAIAGPAARPPVALRQRPRRALRRRDPPRPASSAGVEAPPSRAKASAGKPVETSAGLPAVEPVAARSLQGRLPRRDQEGEEVLLRHGDRAGAAHPRRRRSRRDHLRPAAPRAEVTARADEAASRDHCQPAGRQEDERGPGRRYVVRRIRPARRCGRPGRTPPTARKPPCANRRWPTPASRRCWTCLRLKSRTWKRCNHSRLRGLAGSRVRELRDSRHGYAR